ncbi:hypothetical protein FIM40_06365 [Helicobacter pylori]|nr:hypothetical protein FIM40_06365 [Helicobacter pylori]
MFVFIINRNSSKKINDKINDKDNSKSYCHLLFLKIYLVMKTALFKLLNLTIIPRYTTNYNIKSPL